MKPVLFLFAAVVVPSILLAQQLSHPVNASRDDAFISSAQQRAFPDTVRVLAVMVQFQADTDPLTSGNGQFDLSVPAMPDVEAPPHDAPYFQDHLTFLTNYYRKASGGKVVIQPTLVPTAFTLPALMSSYSPPKNGTNEAVARLARDAWRMVDSTGLVPGIASYDCFVLFHAGVGRDIDLVGTLGYDPTPNDIPSLYLGLNAFREFFGAGYTGIPVQGGAVTNTIVVPETEFRLLPGVGGDVPLRLATNGLLCASVGNFLGLPDLFDTKTGASVLGRFGLMDGQSIFSFGGAFPPMPSAWERSYLGWATVIDAPAGSSPLQLPAVSTADTIYRIAISPDEYFLVENRNRDPEANGQRVMLSYRGTPQTLAVRYDTIGFNADDITALKGVVTDVEDLDWSTPGALDPDGTFYNGGVLIWHVDESVIRATIAQNAVNANPDHRGVDLEEADGSQDIGQQYDLLSPGGGSEVGTPLDFWFQGNLSPVYKNEFSHTSHPNSNAYGGAESHITIRDFGPRGARMQATAIRGDASVTPLAGFPRSLGEQVANPQASLTIAAIGTGESSGFFVTTNAAGHGRLYGWKTENGQPYFIGRASGQIAEVSETFVSPASPTLLATGPRDTTVGGQEQLYTGMIVMNNTGLSAFQLADADHDGLADEVFTVPVSIAPQLSSKVLVVPERGTVCLPTDHGRILAMDNWGVVAGVLSVTQDTTDEITGLATAGLGPYIVGTTRGHVIMVGQGVRTHDTELDGAVNSLPVIANDANGYLVGATTNKGSFYILDSALVTLPGFPVSIGVSSLPGPLAVADVDGDNRKDFVVVTGTDIRAYNTAGVLLNNFPVSAPSGTGAFASAPVLADVNGDGNVDIVAATDNGTVMAVDKSGRMLPGFPLAAGHGAQSLGVTGKNGAASLLIAVSEENATVSAWIINPRGSASASAESFPWPQFQHDAWHSGYEPMFLGTPRPLASGFFPQQRAYNWPNPAYGGTTYLRYFVGQDATVKIKIYDLAGSLVKELAGPGVGGMDNEVAWDVSNVQSGIYFAHIKASGAGQSGETVVKVAVVK